MKKITKLTSVFLALAIFASMCVFHVDAALNKVLLEQYDVVDDVHYAKYNITSKVNAYTKTSTMLTFSPDDGYIPMVFSGYSGTSGTLATQYTLATQRYGYDVVGIINGAFFSMDSGSTQYGNYGTLNGIVISDGKIASAHAGYSDSVVAFGSDGSMNIVNSALDYKLYIEGAEVNGLYYINKTSGSKIASNWKDGFYYYDRSCGTKCDTYAVCPGYEVLCKKVDNTDLSVGHTLIGEVVSVTENTYGGAVGTDEFILFVKSSSSNASYVKDLKAGDDIRISVTETKAESREVMENANSVISNVGWLVKDGVDQTQIVSTIGTHSVTLQARWTAFGTKPDGTYVFFTSEGASTGYAGSLTLQDVAQALIDEGCTNVIRMDGGGSSAMYLKKTNTGSAGYVQSSSRAVGDCILVIKRDSAQSSDLKTALNEKIEHAEEVVNSIDLDVIRAAISDAKKVRDASTSISGDYKREIMTIIESTTGDGLINTMLNSFAAATTDSYSELSLDRFAYFAQEGKRILSSDSYSDAEKIDFAIELAGYLRDTNTDNRLSLGAAYATQSANVSYPDSGLAEMTDGVLFGTGAASSYWTGYQKNNATGTENGKPYLDIMVDLGSVESISAAGVSVCSYSTWNIVAPDSVDLYLSENGVDYFLYDSLDAIIDVETGAYQVIPFELSLDSAINVRYAVFRFFYGGNHLFVGEVSLYGDGGEEFTAVDNFDKYYTGNQAIIFTDDVTTITAANSNITGTYNYICTYDTAKGYYVIEEIVRFENTEYSLSLGSDQLLIALHADEQSGNANVAAASVGDRLVLTGVDVETETIYPGARVTFVDVTDNSITYSAPALNDIRSDKGLTVDASGYYLNLPYESMTDAEINALFTDPRATIGGNYTGAKVSVPSSGKTYTLVLKGDINGDGQRTAVDYLILKRMFMGTYDATYTQKMASRISGYNTVYATDYMKLKRHVLGTYDLDQKQ